MDPLSTTASIIATIQLSSEIVKYISDAAGNTKNRIRLRNEVLGCESILQQLRDDTDDSEEGKKWSEMIKALETPGGPLGRLRVALDIIKTKLQPREGLEKASTALKWPFREKEVNKIISAIEREKSLLGLSLADGYRELIQDIGKSTRESGKQLAELIDAVKETSKCAELESKDHSCQSPLSWAAMVGHVTVTTRGFSEHDGPTPSRQASPTAPCFERVANQSRDSLGKLSREESDKSDSHRQNGNGTWPREQRKVLFSRCKSKAIQHFGFYHFMPVAGTFAILGLYIGQIGWNPDWNVLSTLVAAAKVHESLILVSLVDIMFHRIRHGLMTSRGVPLGFLTAPFQLNSLLALFYRGRTAPLRGLMSRNQSHFRSAVLLAVAFLLAGLTGLSTTILLLPRLDWWFVGDNPVSFINEYEVARMYIANKFDHLYPTNVTNALIHRYCFEFPTYNPDLIGWYSACPQNGFLSLHTSVGTALETSSTVVNVSSGSYRTVTIGLDDGKNPYGGTVIATSPVVPASGILSAVLHSWLDDGGFPPLLVESRAHDSAGSHLWKQPLVSVQCSTPFTATESQLSDPNAWAEFHFEGGIYPMFNVTLDQQARDNYGSVVTQGVVFLDIQRLVPFSISAAFLVDSHIVYDGFGDRLQPMIHLCLVDARWVESKQWTSWPDAENVQIDVTVMPKPLPNRAASEGTQPDFIRLDLSWIHALNVTFNVTTTYWNTHMEYVVNVTLDSAFNAISLACSTSFSDGPPRPYCPAIQYAAYFADALARQHYAFGSYIIYDNLDPAFNNRQWTSPIAGSDFNSSLYQSVPTPAVRDANHTRIDLLFYRHMYSYRLRDITVCLAMAIMLLYAAFVLGHLFVVVGGDGYHSTAWSEPEELLCLAMQSPPSDLLENTGAGIKNDNTWRLKTFVREADEGSKVQLTFEAENIEREPVERSAAPNPDMRYG